MWRLLGILLLLSRLAGGETGPPPDFSRELALLGDARIQQQLLAWAIDRFRRSTGGEDAEPPPSELPAGLVHLREPAAAPSLLAAAGAADPGVQRAALLLLERLGDRPHPGIDGLPFAQRCGFQLWLLRADRPIVHRGSHAVPPPRPPPSLDRLVALGPEVLPALARVLDGVDDAEYAARLAQAAQAVCRSDPVLAWPALAQAWRLDPRRTARTDRPAPVVAGDPHGPWPRLRLLHDDDFADRDDPDANRRALPSLLAALPASGWPRQCALARLAAISGYAPTATILGLLRSPDDGDVRLAMRWAQARGCSGVLDGLLGEVEGKRRERTQDLLAVLARPDHAPALRQRLRAARYLDCAAASALAMLADPALGEICLRRLEAPCDSNELPYLCRHLGDARQVEAVPALIALLERPANREPAAAALLRIGTAPAVAAALAALPEAARRPFPAGRHARAEAVPALAAEARQGRRQAIDGLGQVRDPAAVPQLLALAADPDPLVRLGALHAIARLRPPAGAEALLRALADGGESWLAWTAGRALVLMQDRRAIPGLIGLIPQHPDAVHALVVLVGEAETTTILRQAADQANGSTRILLVAALADLGDAASVDLLAGLDAAALADLGPRRSTVSEVLIRAGRPAASFLANLRAGLAVTADNSLWAIAAAEQMRLREAVPALVDLASAQGSTAAWQAACRIDGAAARSLAVEAILAGRGLVPASTLGGPLPDQLRDRLQAAVRDGRYLPLLALASSGALDPALARTVIADGDPLSRFVAMLALDGTILDRDGREEVQRRFTAARGAERWALLRVLAHGGAPALLPVLESADPLDGPLQADAFSWLAEAVRRQPSGHGQEALANAARFDPSPFRRLEAAGALAARNDPWARGLLAELASGDDDPLVRGAIAIGLLADPASAATAAPIIRAALRQGSIDAQCELVGRLAAAGRSEFADELRAMLASCLDVERLEREPLPRRDLRHRLAIALLCAIERLEDPATHTAAALSGRLFATDEAERLIAMVAMARSGDRRFRSPLYLAGGGDGGLPYTLWRWTLAMIGADGLTGMPWTGEPSEHLLRDEYRRRRSAVP